MKITAYFDGGCHNNQEPTKRQAYGSYVVHEHLPNGPIMVLIGQSFQFTNETNNVAEYLALIKLLYCLIELAKKIEMEELVIYSDSRLIINQVNGSWKCNKEHLVEKRNLCVELIELSLRKLVIKPLELKWIDNKIMKQVLGH